MSDWREVTGELGEGIEYKHITGKKRKGRGTGSWKAPLDYQKHSPVFEDSMTRELRSRAETMSGTEERREDRGGAQTTTFIKRKKTERSGCRGEKAAEVFIRA